MRHHLPWFMVPDTTCWTYKIQYGSSGQLKKHVDEESIKSELDPHVNQEPHQMFGEEHVVEWCELVFGTCWMAHGLFIHASAGSGGIDD